MEKRFLVSVADVYGFIGDNQIFSAKTNSVTSVTLNTSNTDIRGGQGNQLQARFFHSPEMGIELQETQFKMEFIALNSGSAIVNGGNVFTKESVTIANGNGVLTGTPIAVNTTPKVYFEYNNQNISVPVNGQTFSVGSLGIADGTTLCVYYMSQDANARTVVVPANIVPSRIRLVMVANLYGDTNGDGYIGKVQIEIPNAQLSGAMELSMNADGYSNTPLTATALAYSDNGGNGCTNNNYYAKFVETINDANWYDNVVALGIVGGDFELQPNQTKKLTVFAVYADGTSSIVDNSLLSFESADENELPVGEHTGIVGPSGGNGGETVISVSITSKPEIEANIYVVTQPQE